MRRIRLGNDIAVGPLKILSVSTVILLPLLVIGLWVNY